MTREHGSCSRRRGGGPSRPTLRAQPGSPAASRRTLRTRPPTRNERSRPARHAAIARRSEAHGTAPALRRPRAGQCAFPSPRARAFDGNDPELVRAEVTKPQLQLRRKEPVDEPLCVSSSRGVKRKSFRQAGGGACRRRRRETRGAGGEKRERGCPRHRQGVRSDVRPVRPLAAHRPQPRRRRTPDVPWPAPTTRPGCPGRPVPVAPSCPAAGPERPHPKRAEPPHLRALASPVNCVLRPPVRRKPTPPRHAQ